MRAASGRRTRRAGAAYQGAFEAVFAILIAAGFGYWADSAFGTAPLWLLVGLGIGFGAFVLRLVRLGVRLQKLAAEELAEHPEGMPGPISDAEWNGEDEDDDEDGPDGPARF